MLRTKLLALAGLFLTLSSLLFGSRYLGYELAVLLMQTGGFAFTFGLFFRLTCALKHGTSTEQGPERS